MFMTKTATESLSRSLTMAEFNRTVYRWL